MKTDRLGLDPILTDVLLRVASDADCGPAADLPRERAGSRPVGFPAELLRNLLPGLGRCIMRKVYAKRRTLVRYSSIIILGMPFSTG